MQATSYFIHNWVSIIINWRVVGLRQKNDSLLNRLVHDFFVRSQRFAMIYNNQQSFKFFIIRISLISPYLLLFEGGGGPIKCNRIFILVGRILLLLWELKNNLIYMTREKLFCLSKFRINNAKKKFFFTIL